MKKYYAVVKYYSNDNFTLVGYHEKKKVVIKYYKSVMKVVDKASEYSYKLVKIPKRRLKKITDRYDCYLLRFGTTFIPAKHYELAEDHIGSIYCDYKYTEDILKRIYITEKLPSSDKKSLEKTIILVGSLKDELKENMIDPSLLEEMERSFDEYRFKVYDEDYCTYDEEIPFI